MSNVSVEDANSMIWTILNIFVCFELLVWIVGVITTRLCYIHGMIQNIYYDNPFNHGETSVQEWLVECAHKETCFDRGYFKIDVLIFSAVIEFASFLFFAVNN